MLMTEIREIKEKGGLRRCQPPSSEARPFITSTFRRIIIPIKNASFYGRETAQPIATEKEFDSSRVLNMKLE